MKAAVYVRISRDDGTALGVARQEKDCRELAERKGWTVANVYSDNDISAYSGVVRPAYEAMMADVRAGRVQAIVCWDTDRLSRKPVELEALIDLAEQLGVQLASCAGEIDLASPQGRLVARIKAGVARHESEQSSRRIKRAALQRAQEGRPHGRPAYGWRRVDGIDKIEPSEAEIIREIAQRVIAGESLRGIAHDLNQRGKPSPLGHPWEAATLRQVVLRERNAGLRRHQKKVIGKGNWEPIFSEDTYNRVVAVLRDPARKTTTTRTYQHLLSGIATCGKCGGFVRVLKNHQAKSYCCTVCFGVRRKVEDVDRVVLKYVVGRLNKPDALAAFVPETDHEAVEEMASLRAKLDLVADQFANDEIDGEQLTRITSTLRARLAEVEGRITRTMPELSDIRAEDFTDYPLERQRAVIELLCEIKLMPLGSGKSFSPESVSIAARGAA